MDSQSSSAPSGPIDRNGGVAWTEAPDAGVESVRADAHGRTDLQWTGVTATGSSGWREPEGVTLSGRGAEGGAAVERISKLVQREATLFHQHGSDSMAVVLRPDSGTELVLHLSLRNGLVEASVRCERGDFQQLNAWWGQLQDSLGHHKVRLAPLEETASETGQFRNSGGAAQHGRDESARDPRPEDESMDEWPAPASPEQTPATVRSRRESGHRLSTSRPGWETWA